MRCRHPVNGALDLAAVGGPPTARGGIVSTAEFDYLPASLVLHHPSAGNVVGIPQTDLTARGEAEELPGRVLAEILALNVEHARERYLACAHTGVFRIIHGLHCFHLALRIVLNDH